MTLLKLAQSRFDNRDFNSHSRAIPVMPPTTAPRVNPVAAAAKAVDELKRSNVIKVVPKTARSSPKAQARELATTHQPGPTDMLFQNQPLSQSQNSSDPSSNQKRAFS